ncbi:MAG: hypothetical protein JST04_01050 [Bdellovibrionales bacterium]|nr:hypothetical protein [Bdellovibrionales bacterium]
MANTSTMRLIHGQTFDGKGYTNENSLAAGLMTKPDVINPVITHLMGKEEDKFPLTFLTEGQKGGTKYIEINDAQYEWPIINRLRKADVVAVAYTATSRPGVGNGYFQVLMKTNWLKDKHLISSASGYQAQIKGKPQQVGQFYLYTFQGTDPNPLAFCPLADLAVGSKWSMVGGAPVSESLSMGNESNVVMPGRMKNQISFLRKSYVLAGNIGNKITEFQFNVDGKISNYWIDFERYQHMLDWKQTAEEHYWESRYNRAADGSIALKDEDSGLPIPIGAGVIEQIPNSDTYGTLTAQKIKQVVGDAMYGAPDKKNVTLVLYTGYDGLDKFDTAMKGSLVSSGFTVVNKELFVSGAGRHLTLGGFFTAYEHVDGHTVIVKHLPLLDYGGRAESAPLDPISGRPTTSSEMYFVDQSVYDGTNNVQMVTQRGRANIMGVVRGITPMPFDFAGNNNQNIATEQDKNSVHFFSAKGICIRRNTHCFKLLPTLS